MSTLLDLIGQQLKSADLGSIGAQLGLSPAATQAAVAHSLPAMIGNLANQADSSPQAAEAIHASLDQSAATASSPGAAASATQTPTIAEQHAANLDDATLANIANSTGLNVSQLQDLLPRLAPLLTAALGQAKQTQGLSTSGTVGLLQSASQHLEEQMGSAVGYIKSHPDQVKSGLVGAGVALAGNYLMGRLFSSNKPR